MKKNSFDSSYWDNRYKNKTTAWDIGKIATPIKEYIDQLTDKTLRILIPGAGNGYEAEYLWNNGFKNVFVLDISKQPLDDFLQRVNGFPKSNALHMNFFELNDTFDLIIEHTFFCALAPKLRMEYVYKMKDLIVAKGKLVGLLFDFELTESGPPFGGNQNLYKTYFGNHFHIKTLERAHNSINQRQDKELFFIFEKSII